MKSNLLKTMLLYLVIILSKYSFSQKEIGYFIKEDNTKVKMYTRSIFTKEQKNNPEWMEYFKWTSIDVTASSVIYFDKSGKEQIINQKNILELHSYIDSFNYKKYIQLPIYKNGGMPRLHRIVAYSSDYTLTVYIDDQKYYMYIFDKSKEMILDKFYYYYQGDYTGKYDKSEESSRQR